MKGMMVTAQKQGDKFNEICSELKSLRGKLDCRKNNIEELIKSRSAKAIEEINEEGNRLLSELEVLHEAEQGHLLESLNNVSKLLQRMSAGQGLVENMLCYGTDQEVMEMHGEAISALSVLREAKEAHVSTGNLSSLRESEISSFHTLRRKTAGVLIMPGTKGNGQ
ncbi:protein PML isoform X2 [Callorhinchus milii]|uniref:protein PML isoform X2 n=1 Tax=Callorhinchus milii TaxID=7868 RepID=UPI001C3F6D86|nr:protein PML isoform X2 [Callorhinchus milii]